MKVNKDNCLFLIPHNAFSADLADLFHKIYG